jgi:hypothetical protein
MVEGIKEERGEGGGTCKISITRQASSSSVFNAWLQWYMYGMVCVGCEINIFSEGCPQLEGGKERALKQQLK